MNIVGAILMKAIRFGVLAAIAVGIFGPGVLMADTIQVDWFLSDGAWKTATIVGFDQNNKVFTDFKVIWDNGYAFDFRSVILNPDDAKIVFDALVIGAVAWSVEPLSAGSSSNQAIFTLTLPSGIAFSSTGSGEGPLNSASGTQTDCAYPVPEPASILLLTMGLGSIVLAARPKGK